ncbi:MAG: hypothetical protein RLZZ347_562 [Candidatus Parcubacteria bacterium]|jgi:hypothetical protein
MKTIVLLVNGRVLDGDPAKEVFVGVYRVANEAVFRKAIEEISTELNSGKWLLPEERVDRLMAELAQAGYRSMTTTQVFATVS